MNRKLVSIKCREALRNYASWSKGGADELVDNSSYYRGYVEALLWVLSGRNVKMDAKANVDETEVPCL